MAKIKELYKKYKEIILYVFYGGLTTLVNLVAYWVFDLILGADLYLVTNVIAWVIAATFAYVVNKLFVFDSKSWAPAIIGKEILEFLGARVFSFGVEELGMLLFVDGFNFKDIAIDIFGIFTLTGALIAKIILAVIVIILNYFFSKFIIFKKKPEKGDNTAKSAEDASTAEGTEGVDTAKGTDGAGTAEGAEDDTEKNAEESQQ